MKRSAVLFIALFLFGGAFGHNTHVTLTSYSDANCGSKASGFTVDLDTCGNAFSGFVAKASVCSASSFTMSAYQGTSCDGTATAAFSGKPGDCIKTDPPPGSQSFKIECSNATSPPSTTTAKSPPSTTVKSAAPNPVSLMALILAFAFAAICAQV
jgi:hypothetical protein